MKVCRIRQVFIDGLLRNAFWKTWNFLSLLSVPISAIIILHSRNIHKSYSMTPFRKLKLGVRMFLNTRRIARANVKNTYYKAHLVMALKILETPPDVPGDIIECGTWQGCSAANLSLVCRIARRKLKVYDSFAGLPKPEPGEHIAKATAEGGFLGTLEEVKSNITRYGAIECCEFNKGWFKDTLPQLDSPILLAFLDVDFESSIHTCVKYIWPNLIDRGYLFTDDSSILDLCALFYSEKWWRKYFNSTPPGLIGAGTGIPIGNYDFYIAPELGMGRYHKKQFQSRSSYGYTQKTMSGYWSYYPDDDVE